MKTEILSLLQTKQIWEMSDMELMKVKMELPRMNGKVHNEQALRHMCDNPDTPLAEMYGG